MHIQTLIESSSAFSPILAYLLIFLGITIEGDIVLFTSAFLAYQGHLDIGIIFAIALVGVYLRDLMWYEVGRRLHQHQNFIGRWAQNLAEPFDEHLIERPIHSLCIAKFVYGLHLAIIIRAGMLKIPLKKFIEADTVAAVAWILVIGILGYASGASFEAARAYLKYAEVGLAIGIVTFLLVHRYISRASRKSLGKGKKRK